jgi:hypothetical protein
MFQNERSNYRLLVRQVSQISAGWGRMEEDKGDFANKSENMIKVLNIDVRSDLRRMTGGH